MSGWVRMENITPEALERKMLQLGLEPLSDKAFRLWFNAICFCSRAETDGHVPGDRLLRLSDSASKRVVDELVAAGLLERSGRSYVVHDYLEHNPSRARIQELREQGRKRVEKHRGNAVTNGTSNEGETSQPPARERARSVSSSSSVPTSTNDQSGGHPGDDSLPAGFPPELTGHLDAVHPVLADLAERHGAKAVTRLSLASVVAAHPRKPLVRAAREYVSWADGKAQRRRDVIAGYRNWLGRTDNLAAAEPISADGRSTLRDFSELDRAAGL